MTQVPLSDASQELIDAIADATRQLSGRRDERAREKFKRLILWREKGLNNLADRAVRMAVALNAVDPRGYHNAMYARLPVLNAAAFRSMILEAARAGRLEGVADANGDKLIFTTPKLTFFGKPYSIQYKQMPLSVVFLAFMHNTITPLVVDEVIDGIRDELGAVDIASRNLLKQLETWLNDHLNNEYRLRQARAIREHLRLLENAKAWFDRATSPSGEVETIRVELADWTIPETVVEDRHKMRWPISYQKFRHSGTRTYADEPYEGKSVDLIDDETILSFWERVNLGPAFNAEQVGARNFRAAARLVLDYRLALSRAAVRLALDGAASVVREDRRDFDIMDARTRSAVDDLDGDRFESEEADYDLELGSTIHAVDGDAELWTSPLIGLAGREGDPVKWLTASDVDLLGKVFDNGAGGSSLFGREKPQRQFARTILRTLHFGDLQAVAIARGCAPSILFDSDPYIELRKLFEALADKVEHLAYATAYALILRRSKVEALALLLSLDPDLRAKTFGGRPELMSADRLADAMVEKLMEPANALGKRMKAGYRATNRAGFRPSDEEDETYTWYLEQGAKLVPSLLEEIATIAEWLKSVDAHNAFSIDARRFEHALSALYGQGVPSA